MLPVKPGCSHSAQEELRAVRVGSRVSHRENPLALMTQNEVFVFEFSAVDRFASGSVVGCEVSSLARNSEIALYSALYSVIQRYTALSGG